MFPSDPFFARDYGVISDLGEDGPYTAQCPGTLGNDGMEPIDVAIIKLPASSRIVQSLFRMHVSARQESYYVRYSPLFSAQ